MTAILPNPEHVNNLVAAARARLDALRSADLPDDITPLEVLTHCRAKRLKARKLYIAMLDAEVPREDPERQAAVVALDLAEHEAELFLERWLDDAIPPAYASQPWDYVSGIVAKWDRADPYYSTDMTFVIGLYDDQLTDFEGLCLEHASDWAVHHYPAARRAYWQKRQPYQLGPTYSYRPAELVRYIEGLDYCNMEWRDAFENRRKVPHAQKH